MTINHHPTLSPRPTRGGRCRRLWRGLLGGILLLLLAGLSLPDLVQAQSASVSAGGLHTCSLEADGTVSCWGDNDKDQLDVPASLVATAVSAGGYHTCALQNNGMVSCWGSDDKDQTTVPSNLGTTTAISAGYFHTCALDSNGTVSCWGNNDYDQRTVPGGIDATAVSAGNDHTCALQKNGTVSCWGSDDKDQTTVPSDLGTTTAISAGNQHTCALDSNGAVSCWGSDSGGKSTVPGGIDATAVSAGGNHTCALQKDGTVSCWGRKSEGQTDVPDGLVATAISAGPFHTCALAVNWTVTCWGGNSEGQTTVPFVVVVPLYAITLMPNDHTIGLGATEAVEATGFFRDGSMANLTPGLLLPIRVISAGFYHTCALETYGTVSCWGRSNNDRTAVPDRLVATALSAGGGHTCALTPDRTVICWGLNSSGQTNVPGGLVATAISAGGLHTCALQKNGPVSCWGNNGDLQLDVPPNLDATAITAGDTHTCALDSNGVVSCWGNSSNNRTMVPPELGPARAVSAGYKHTCALDSDGAVSCWGGNSEEQTEVPEEIKDINNGNFTEATAVSAGHQHTCALKVDGTVSCWGYNSHGQTTVPADLETTTAISAAGWHTCAQETNGTVVCWGNDADEQTTMPLRRLTWGSSNQAVATINREGLVTARATGTTTLSAELFDVSGQTTLTVEDRTPPNIFPLVMGTLGTNVSDGQTFGWYTSDVTVSWTVWDDESNITSYDNCDPTVISADTTAVGLNVTCTAQSAGGTNSVTVTILRDTAAPTVNLATPSDGTTYEITESVTADWSVSDTGSGVSTSSGTAANGEIIATTVGTKDFTVSATDNAGNTTMVMHQYTVLPATLDTITLTPADPTIGVGATQPMTAIGTFSDGSTTVLTPGLPLRATAVSAGSQHTCALEGAGTVTCWGNSSYGRTTVPPELGPATAVSAGSQHTCAVGVDRTVTCWGQNDRNQAAVPEEIKDINNGNFVGATAVSANRYHTCALRTDGIVTCWGSIAHGRTMVPAELGLATAVSAGFQHTCALGTDGTVTCWGSNNDGRTTVPNEFGPFTAVSAGDIHTCALGTDGTVTCWGSNDDGQATVPAQLGTATAISAGSAHTCALEDDGTVTCWGLDSDDLEVPTNLVATAISAGGEHTCVLETDGTVTCWGSTNRGQTTVPVHTLTWGSSNQNVATIDVDGLATGVAVGVTNLSADLFGVSGQTMLTVGDTMPPVVTAPLPVTVEAVDALGTPDTDETIQTFLNGATSIDDVDGPLTPTNDAPAKFPLGITTVTFSAMDAAGNTGSDTSTVTVADTTLPVITLLGSSPVTVEVGSLYDASVDAGATASDTVDGDVTANIVTTGLSMDTSAPETFQVTYDVSDHAGNAATQVTRTVNVVDTTPPVITLLGDSLVTVEVGSPYADAGATAEDNLDGNVTGSLVTNNPVDPANLGTYLVTYDVSDQAGNLATQVTRTVNVVDTTPPVVTAPPSITVEAVDSDGTPGTHTDIQTFLDAATAIDGVDGTLTPTNDAPAKFLLGSTTVTFSATDAAGNTSSASSTVTVADTTLPVITLLGTSPVTVEVGSLYDASVDAGATASDTVDGDVTSSLVTGGLPVDTNATGIFQVTYDVSDQAGNPATQVTRTVNVVDTTPPVITLLGDSLVTVEVGSPYADAGATASDTVDGNITAHIVTTGLPIDSTVLGSVLLITYTVSDKAGNPATPVMRTVTVVNTPPVVTSLSLNSASINENDSVTLDGSFVDPTSIDSHTVRITWGEGSPITVVNLSQGLRTFQVVHQYLDDVPTHTPLDSPLIQVTVTDSQGGVGGNSTNIVVNNVAPVIPADGISGPVGPIALGVAALVTATFNDVGSLDTHTCTFSWGDGTADDVVALVGTGNTSCAASHPYASPGIYQVTATVEDDDTGTVSRPFDFVVVYDPDGGFVTGRGFIDSPRGAYRPDPTLTGKASFGFVSKYKKGAKIPTGTTEFHFKAASFNFNSSDYEWLVVAGAKAQFKGSGNINGHFGSDGVSGYGFLLTATDGQRAGGGGVDKFRIKVVDKATDTVVYDNNTSGSDDIDAANPQEISGGSIVIHTKKHTKK